MDPRALAYVMMQQGRSLAEIRNALSAQDAPLEEIDEISEELVEPMAERDALAIVNARQDVRGGGGMLLAGAAIAGLVALSDLPSTLYIIPLVAALVGIVRLAGGLAKISSGKRAEKNRGAGGSNE